ncbi:MAG TPA: aminotransferase class I/II-fold pyridoxal phosphate-dependent enzyme [Alphaproteobacteria bacterium]|nr:aminotransferase class I/II-fold pyridoxal phosphate-dependent enzyme [Alphaproteobacteria bacterium]
MADDEAKPADPVARLPFVRAEVAALGPARVPTVEADIRAVGGGQPVLRRLNLNESAFPPSPLTIAAIQAAASDVNRYPDPKGRALRAALATRIGVAAERIVLGNGSDELIALIGQMTLERASSAVLPTPSFPRYLHAAKLAGAMPIAAPVDAEGANDTAAMLTAIRADTRLVYCATPNNPTGAMLDEDRLRDFVTAVPDRVLLAIDEAYFEFARHAGGPDAFEVLTAARRGPWVLLRTLSKAYGIAGLRVGYCVASDATLAEALNRMRGAFNVNVVAQAAALAALGDEAHTRKLVDDCARERARLSAGLRRMGCEPLPSVANFVSAPLPIPASESVPLLAQLGVMVGAVGPAPFDRYIRVTVGTPEDTDVVLAALGELLGQP